MKRFAIFMTLLSALFSGCGKEEADSITGYDRTMLFNSVAADCTSVGPFAFTAAAEWQTRVVDMSSDGLDAPWITVTPSSGVAGRNEIMLTFGTNTSGRVRRAGVNITCGETMVTVSVEQAAEGGSQVGTDNVTLYADEEFCYTGGALTNYSDGCDISIYSGPTAETPDWVDLTFEDGRPVLALSINGTHADRKAEVELSRDGKLLWVTTLTQSAVCADGSYPL